MRTVGLLEEEEHTRTVGLEEKGHARTVGLEEEGHARNVGLGEEGRTKEAEDETYVVGTALEGTTYWWVVSSEMWILWHGAMSMAFRL